MEKLTPVMTRVPQEWDSWVECDNSDNEVFETIYDAFGFANDKYGYTEFRLSLTDGMIYGIVEDGKEDVPKEEPKRFNLYGDR